MIPNAIGSDLPIDPNEPTYCYCQRVSFGHMIACDNSEVGGHVPLASSSKVFGSAH